MFISVATPTVVNMKSFKFKLIMGGSDKKNFTIQVMDLKCSSSDLDKSWSWNGMTGRILKAVESCKTKIPVGFVWKPFQYLSQFDI